MNKDDLIVKQQEVTALRAEGKYKETILAAYNLLENGTKLNDHKSILVAHINLAASFYYIGDIEEAFKNIEAHADYCNLHGDHNDRLNSYNIFFVIYNFNKDYQKAKVTLEKCIELGKKLKKYNIVSNAYSNYSHVLLEEKNYEEALQMGLKGLEMARFHEPASEILEIRVKLNIASAYVGLEDTYRSKMIIDEIMGSSILDSFHREKTQCYHLLSHWYSKQGLLKKAFESLSTAKEMVESINDIILLKEIQEARCDVCEKMENPALGYIVQKEYIEVLKEVNERELAQIALKLDIKQNMTLMEKKANTDYLSGLYNRSYLEEITNKWLEQTTDNKESIVCVAFDIDNFKVINDEYGHLAGDQVIKEVGQCCATVIRENDVIGRYGGDEFVIILRGITLENGIKKANQILEAIRIIQINLNGKLISLTVSIGIADSSECKEKSFNNLFHLADLRLYNAKESGKNQVSITN